MTNKFKSDSEHDSYYHSFVTKTNWNNQKIRNSNLLVIKHVLQTKLLRGKAKTKKFRQMLLIFPVLGKMTHMYCMYVLYNVLCVFLSCFFRSWINDKVVWSSFVGLFQQLFFVSCFVETPTLLSHPLANSADLQIYRDVAWFFYDQQI